MLTKVENGQPQFLRQNAPSDILNLKKFREHYLQTPSTEGSVPYPGKEGGESLGVDGKGKWRKGKRGDGWEEGMDFGPLDKILDTLLRLIRPYG